MKSYNLIIDYIIFLIYIENKILVIEFFVIDKYKHTV